MLQELIRVGLPIYDDSEVLSLTFCPGGVRLNTGVWYKGNDPKFIVEERL